MQRTLSFLGLALALAATARAEPVVGKWERFVIALENTSHAGNPFEIDVDGTFVHSSSGTSLTLPGYYAGEDVWKIGFMPPRTGTWTYSTVSSDPDLDQHTGSISCVSSGRPGLLAQDSANERKWKYRDGPYVIPIGLLFSVFLEEITPQQFENAADFLADEVGGHLFGFRLTNLAFEGPWQDHRLDLELWDRLEQRMEVLAERGLGVAVMPYTDDQGKPPWPAQSPTVALLFPYMFARLAAFPVVVFNTGIDIAEYRNQSWVNWYGQLVRSLDPYGHPVSSRHDGGSGNLVMNGQRYDSLGHPHAEIVPMRNAYLSSADIPVGEDDNWGEQSERFNFGTPADIRRAFWKLVVAGGLGASVRDNQTSNFPGANDPDLWFHASNMATRLDSEQWLRLVNPFVRDRLGDAFAQMEPDTSLVADGYALADGARTIILYFLPGIHDLFDPEPDATFVAKLSNVGGSLLATWFDPRTGQETSLGVLDGGEDYTLSTPTNDDWLLLLTAAQGSTIFTDGFESDDTSAWSSTVH